MLERKTLARESKRHKSSRRTYRRNLGHGGHEKCQIWDIVDGTRGVVTGIQRARKHSSQTIPR